MNKVLHLRSSGGLFGAEKVIIELCKHSKKNNFEPHVGVFHNAKDPVPAFYKALQDHKIRSFLFTDKSAFSFKCITNIENYCNQNQISLIHTHGYKEDIHAFFLKKIPKIATNHLWKQPDFKSSIYTTLDTLSLRSFSSIVGVSDEIVTDLHTKGLKKAFKIPNGIDLSLFDNIDETAKARLRASFSFSEKAIVTGMISSLTPEKNHQLGINAFRNIKRNFPDAKLLIVGDGPKKQELKELTIQSGIENSVIFAGTRSDIPEILSIIDIFLLTSKIEGLPIALLEAMASGKAIITTAVGEIPNVISNDIGILVRTLEEQELESALSRLLSNEQLRINLAQSARKRSADFSSEQMTKAYCETYNKVLLATH